MAHRSGVLVILCEGHQTEPKYFADLRRQQEIHGVSVLRLARGGGVSQLQRLLERECESRSGDDEIWCVLDHDERDDQIAEFEAFVARRQKRTSVPIHIALSRPCFEYWLLLHFTHTTRAYRGFPGRSACAQVIEELKRHLPDYRKNDSRLFEKTRDRIPDAIERAKRPRPEGASSTEVGRLVERLLALAATADSN